MYLKQDFCQIVSDNQDWLMRYVMTMVKNKQDTEDIIQEVFIRAYKNYDSYEESGRIKTWLRTIARNVTLRHLSSTAKQSYISLNLDIGTDDKTLQLADAIPDQTTSTEEQTVGNDLRQQILNAIYKLPDEQRQVVYYRYLKDFSITEVAALTHQPAGTVKSKSYYGLEKVRKSISKYLMEGEYIMDCRESYALLYQYAKNKILPKDRANLEEHITVCNECKNIAEALKILAPQITPAKEREIRHYLIAIPLKNNETLYYFGANGFFDNYEEINKMLADNDGYLTPGQWESGHDSDFDHFAEFDNEGNHVEYDLVSNPLNPRHVRVVYKRMKQVYPEHIVSSVGIRKGSPFNPLMEAPNLMIGKLQNQLGGNAKSGLYLAIPANAKNVRIKKGNDVISAGPYKFAFSERYVTEDETIKLECSYLKK